MLHTIISADVHWPKQVTKQAGCGSRKCGLASQISPEMGQAETAFFCSTIRHKHEAVGTPSPRENLLYLLVWTFGFTHYIVHRRILLKQSHSRWACCASTRTWVCFSRTHVKIWLWWIKAFPGPDTCMFHGLLRIVFPGYSLRWYSSIMNFKPRIYLPLLGHLLTLEIFAASDTSHRSCSFSVCHGILYT